MVRCDDSWGGIGVVQVVVNERLDPRQQGPLAGLGLEGGGKTKLSGEDDRGQIGSDCTQASQLLGIARRGVAHGSGLDKVRWVVERAFAWSHQFKRLRTRYERGADLRQVLFELVCSLICLRRLGTSY